MYGGHDKTQAKLPNNTSDPGQILVPYSQAMKLEWCSSPPIIRHQRGNLHPEVS